MFHYSTLDAVKAEGYNLPLSENLSVLAEPLQVGGVTLPNRLAIQPMEGCDGNADGSPAQLTIDRYDSFARSGAGLIWMEATAICPEGRANPRQLWLTEENVDAFAALNARIREIAAKENGINPILICQATHSGRYSKPEGVPAPLVAYKNPLFEKDNPLSDDRVVSDDYLKSLEEKMAATARLAQKAGFDGVDVKSCHRYLGSELLSGYLRPGIYGGSFENRTRFLRNCVAAATAATTGDFLVTSRLNVYDGFPYPYGFGVKEGEGITPDLTEGLKLIEILHKELGVSMLDITIGNPYVNPHVNRPADICPYEIDESPLYGVERMMSCVGTIQKAFPELAVVGSGFSYLRQFSGQLAAGAVEQGVCQVAGFGRLAFAYPDFPKALLSGAGLDPKRICITCSKCTQLMRLGSKAGCVVRNPVYTALYREATAK